MATNPATSVASARLVMLQSLLLLAVAVVPWPERWTGLRSVIASARSPELNRAEREVHAAGYYEGLIGGGDGPEGARGELALRLDGQTQRLGAVQRRRRVAPAARRLPSVRARAGRAADPLRPAFRHQLPRHAQPGGHTREAAREPSASPCSGPRWTWAGA